MQRQGGYGVGWHYTGYGIKAIVKCTATKKLDPRGSSFLFDMDGAKVTCVTGPVRVEKSLLLVSGSLFMSTRRSAPGRRRLPQ